jgi:hypothetical protein
VIQCFYVTASLDKVPVSTALNVGHSVRIGLRYDFRQVGLVLGHEFKVKLIRCMVPVCHFVKSFAVDFDQQLVVLGVHDQGRQEKYRTDQERSPECDVINGDHIDFTFAEQTRIDPRELVRLTHHEATEDLVVYVALLWLAYLDVFEHGVAQPNTVGRQNTRLKRTGPSFGPTSELFSPRSRLPVNRTYSMSIVCLNSSCIIKLSSGFGCTFNSDCRASCCRVCLFPFSFRSLARIQKNSPREKIEILSPHSKIAASSSDVSFKGLLKADLLQDEF